MIVPNFGKNSQSKQQSLPRINNTSTTSGGNKQLVSQQNQHQIKTLNLNTNINSQYN
jgi:hypothetical protein